MKKIFLFVLLAAVALCMVSALHSTAGPPALLPLSGPAFLADVGRLDLTVAAKDAVIEQSQRIEGVLLQGISLPLVIATYKLSAVKSYTLAGLIWGLSAVLMMLFAGLPLRFRLRDRMQAMPRDQSTA